MGSHGGKRAGAGRKAGSGKYGENTQLLRIPDSMVDEVRCFIECKQIASEKIPLYMSNVPAGSPSLLQDDVEDFVDLNEFFVRNREATFMVMAEGNSMLGANIHSGDVLIVDRSIEPRNGHIVIAALDGNLTVKRLHVEGEHITLKPENDAYDNITVGEHNSLHIWGVVTHIIHKSI